MLNVEKTEKKEKEKSLLSNLLSLRWTNLTQALTKKGKYQRDFKG
jgi:hypothetical protein